MVAVVLMGLMRACGFTSSFVNVGDENDDDDDNDGGAGGGAMPHTHIGEVQTLILTRMNFDIQQNYTHDKDNINDIKRIEAN